MSMAETTPKLGRELTGRKVLLITVAFFGVVIAVNVTMAVKAVRTFPGLEVDNSYVASQTFDVDRAAQEALGWTVDARVEGTNLLLDITGPDGEPAELGSITGIFGRPTEAKDDQTPEFIRAPNGTLVAQVGELDFGYWNFRLQATAPDGTGFKQRLQIYVSED